VCKQSKSKTPSKNTVQSQTNPTTAHWLVCDDHHGSIWWRWRRPLSVVPRPDWSAWWHLGQAQAVVQAACKGGTGDGKGGLPQAWCRGIWTLKALPSCAARLATWPGRPTFGNVLEEACERICCSAAQLDSTSSSLTILEPTRMI
jgi:hypothetical protein